jgi:dolichol-phosphate mannosyltransferase
VINGQCLLARRAALAAAGGFAPVRGYLTDDIALGRSLARRGWRIGFLDGHQVLEVDMHDSVTGVYRDWGRSLPMADVTATHWQAADLALLGLTTALPLARLAAGRPGVLDLVLLGVRGALLAPLRHCYARPGPGFYCSPLADLVVFLRLAGATLRPVRTWRGRHYPAGPASLTARAAGPAGAAGPARPDRSAAQ